MAWKARIISHFGTILEPNRLADCKVMEECECSNLERMLGESRANFSKGDKIQLLRVLDIGRACYSFHSDRKNHDPPFASSLRSVIHVILGL